MGSLNVYGVYGDVNKDLNTDKFCIEQDISIKANKNFKSLLWYMLGVNGWDENKELHYGNSELEDLLDLPKEVKGSSLRTKAKTVDEEGCIHRGVYLTSLFTPKLFYNISSILTHSELDSRSKFNLTKTLPYETLLMYNEIRSILSKIVSLYRNMNEDRFIDFGDFTKSKFYTKKELEAFKRYQLPRIELDSDGLLFAISPDGIIMNINDIEEPYMLLSLIFFFNRGYSYLDKKKMFAIVVPKHFRYTEFFIKGNKVDGEVHFLTIAITIKKDYLLRNVTLIYDEDIEMLQK